ncbi:MAPEG family protein [Nitrospirillum amazonense]|uniref:MAPEG family protein n=1 Tax=Nitrospirillum amazonense TaxID=28077 RepID=A0A560JIM2_9PROT|nr:MAPEG family protein [Nitrospirillum amazonense]MDG3439770.1 MAPEG family protein [Nitrospirillum amazonense]TWB70817.1 MAPEG family protein [Nitrospirillum amazonense]
MQITSEIHLLLLVILATIMMWIPYTVARILTRGLIPALSYPNPSYPPDPAWAERARRAHANAIENLAPFAPLVLITTMIGASTPTTALAAQVYLAARLVHYVVYAAGIPVIRTLAFVTGWGATLVLALTLLGHAG